MLDMLKRSDDQMFEGWEDYPCVFSDCHVKTLARVADAAADMLQVRCSRAECLQNACVH